MTLMRELDITQVKAALTGDDVLAYGGMEECRIQHDNPAFATARPAGENNHEPF